MDWGEIAKIAAGAVAALGAVVGATRYVTQLQDRLEASAEKSKYEGEKRELQEAVARLADENRRLQERHRTLLESGNAALALKSAIDEALNDAAFRVSAKACSILVPAPSDVPDDKPEALVFLSLFPDNPQLRVARIGIDSIAGRALASQRSLIEKDPSAPGSFASRTDKVAGFETKMILATPLFHKGRCVGVAEFLNKRGSLPFDLSDQETADEAVRDLGAKVGDFVSDPRNLKGFGITPRQKASEATILMSDISNSSELAANLDASVVIDLMNQYFEALCDVGLRHGGTIDQFLGDGFMMTFNVKRPLANHRSAAVEAAIEMQKRFAELKAKWTAFQYPGMPRVYNRIGLTTGPVHKAELGHSQFRQITVMGDAVNSAAHLCQNASRQRNVIVVGQALYDMLSPRPPASEVDLQQTKYTRGKAFELTPAA